MFWIQYEMNVDNTPMPLVVALKPRTF